jgi:hypothetical protein
MLDPIQIPILLKAIDFIFDEGRKILDERRERRKANQASSKTETPVKNEEKPPQAEVTSVHPEQSPALKKDLLATSIDNNSWLDHEDEVQHLVRLLETYTRNYHLAQEQYAKWGDALVPPIIVNNLTSAENSVAETLQRLETVLSKVYKKDISSNQ